MRTSIFRICLLSIILLCVCGVIIAQPTIVMSSVSANVNDEVVIDVDLSGLTGQSYSSLTYWAYYDSTKLDFLGYDFGSSILPADRIQSSENFNESGSLGFLSGPIRKLNFGFFDANKFSNQGNLVKLRFRVKAPGTAQITRYYFALGNDVVNGRGGVITTNTPPSAVSISTPANNASLSMSGLPTETLSFNWPAAVDPDAQTLSYTLELATVSNFSIVAYSKFNAGTFSNVTYKTIDSLLVTLGTNVGQVRSIYARVISSDGDASTTGAVSTFNFTRGVINTPPTAAEITVPSDGTEIIIQGNPTELFVARWSESTDADGDNVNYTWQLSTRFDFQESSILYEVVNLATEQIDLDVQTVANVLDAAGAEVGVPITLYHRAQTTDGKVTTNGVSKSVVLVRGTLTNIGEELPVEFGLNQNYPNPFNPVTTISYQVAESRMVSVNIYDMLGRKVATLVNEVQPAGSYNISFDAARLSTGIYIYRMVSGDFVQTRKMTLMK